MPDIKSKVKLDGEKEYKKAIADINAALRVHNSELKLLSEQYADNSDSVEALEAVNDALSRQISTQKEKIEDLKGILEIAARDYGEADSKTLGWKASLNAAEAELVKLNRRLDENQAALNEASKETDDLGDHLDDAGKASKKMGESAEDAAEKTGKLGDAAEAVKTGFQAALAAATALTAAIGALAVGMTALTTEAAAEATQMEQLAQTVNMGVEASQKWDYVLKTLGSSLEEAQGDLSAFQEKMLEATDAESETAKLFSQMGVSVTDGAGKLRDTESVLFDLIHALQDMDDVTQRNAISSDLLGGTGEKLVPIYNQTADALDSLLEKKEAMGLLDEQEIETLTRVSEANLELEERAKALRDTIAVELAPVIERVMEIAGESITGISNWLEEADFDGAISTILTLLDKLSPVTNAMKDVVEAAISGIAGFIENADIDGALERINELVDMLSPAFEAMKEVGGIAIETLVSILNTSGMERLLESIVGLVESLAPLLGDVLSIVDDLTPVIDVFATVLGGLVDVVTVFVDVIRLAVDGVGALIGLFTGNSGKYIEDMMQIGGKYSGVTFSTAPARATYNAAGTQNWHGGLTWVGENGPELLALPQGTQIYNNQDSRSFGGDTWNITIDARSIQELEDIVRIAKNARRVGRMG